MSAIMIKHFSWIDFIQGLKAAKFTDAQAEYLAKKTEDLIEDVLAQTKEFSKQEVDNKELATKGDMLIIKKEIKELEAKIKELDLKTNELSIKIEQYKYASLKFTVWTGCAVVIAIGSMLAKGFHWL